MDVLDRIRDFNRFYTRALGLTGRSYLQSGRSWPKCGWCTRSAPPRRR